MYLNMLRPICVDLLPSVRLNVADAQSPRRCRRRDAPTVNGIMAGYVSLRARQLIFCFLSTERMVPATRRKRARGRKCLSCYHIITFMTDGEQLVTDPDFEDSDRATPPAGLPPQMPRLKLPWEQPPENLAPAFLPHLRSFALMEEIRLLLSTMTRGELMSLPREIRDIVEAFHDSAEELGERALAINVAAVTAAAATTADAASATTAVAAVNAQHPRSYPAQGPVRSKQRSHSLL